MTVTARNVARKTAFATAWNLVRLALQVITLLLLARALGTAGYGALTGIVSIFLTAAQLVGLGSGTVLVRQLARGSKGEFASVLWLHLGTALILCVLVLGVLILIGRNLPMSDIALCLLAVTEIILFPSLWVIAAFFQGREQIGLASATLLLAPAARLCATLVLCMLTDRSVGAFAYLYIACATTTVACAWIAFFRTCHPTLHGEGFRGTATQGIPFAVSNVSAMAMTELDKTFVLHFSGKADAGVYAAAMRVVQTAAVPIASLVVAASPALFRSGRQLSRPTINRMVGAGLVYGVLAAGAIYLIAPYAMALFGHGYELGTPIIRFAALLAVTGSLRQIVLLLLSTSDLQRTRVGIELVGCAIYLALLAWLAPAHGPRGVICATLACDAALAVAAYAMLSKTTSSTNQR